MEIQLQLEIMLRLVFALVIGAVIGYERHAHNKPAGARTHSLVCLASALFMIISIYGFGDFHDPATVRRDPARLAAQVISGMGFIGAGVIWKEGLNIRGLTTATTLWLASGLGLASGSGMYIPALISTFLAFIVLQFNSWEAALDRKRKVKKIRPQLEEVNIYGLRFEIEKIIQEPMDYDVSGSPENVVVSLRFYNIVKDPFFLTIGLKENVVQVIIFRLPQEIRGQGLGSRICQVLIAWSKENGMKKISVTSRSEAIDFWLKNNFLQVDEKTFIYNL